MSRRRSGKGSRKRWLACVLASAMVLTAAVPCSAPSASGLEENAAGIGTGDEVSAESAAEGVQTGYVDGTNEQVSWTYDPETKTAVVTGSGVRTGYVSTSCFPAEAERIEFVNCELGGDLGYLFRGLSSLKTIDFTGLTANNITDMRYMFKDCSELTELDLSSFDTSNVTNMEHVFDYCVSLTALDVGSFDTVNVTNMNHMFSHCSSLTELDVSHFDTASVTDMNGMFYWCVSLIELDVSHFDTGSVTDMSWMFHNCTVQELNVSNFDTGNVTDMEGMFDGCGAKQLAVDSFDTHSVTNMSGMFHNCDKLSELNVSGLDTSNVTDMSLMFYGCNGLQNLDVIHFHTSNVTDMSWMFGYCSSLAELDVSSFDTGSVTDMNMMFYNCGNLAELDLSNFDTSRVTDMTKMFSGCSALKSLNLENFNFYNVGGMEEMFSGCGSLETLHTPKSIGSVVIALPAAYSDPEGRVTESLSFGFTDTVLTKVKESQEQTGYVDATNEQVSWTYDPETKITTVTGSGARVTGGIINQSCFPKDTKRIVFSDCVMSGSYNGLFWGLLDLEAVDFTGLTVRDLTSMSHMFDGCSSLAGVDLSGFDTSAVTDMGYLFTYCSGLKTLELGNFDTGSVTNMTAMFSGCDGLKELNLGSFDLRKLSSAEDMFEGCDSLHTIHTPHQMGETVIALPALFSDSKGRATQVLSQEFMATVLSRAESSQMLTGYVNGTDEQISWIYDTETKKALVSGSGTRTMKDVYDLSFPEETEQIEFRDCVMKGSYYGLFTGLRQLKSIDFKGLRAEHVTDMEGMFNGCKSLEKVDLSGFDTADAGSMACMFWECGSLTEAVLNIATDNVTDMRAMFVNCENLKRLDLSSFHTSKVTDMSDMFCGCYALEELVLGNFDTSSVTNMKTMFFGCNNLRELDLRGFDTGAVTNMQLMFCGCSSLIELDLGSFHTENVEDMRGMFNGCSRLEELNLEGFTIGNTTETDEKDDLMFDYCFSIQRLHTPKQIGVSAIALPVPLYDPKGRETKELTAEFAGTILTSVPDYVISDSKEEIKDALGTEEVKKIDYVLPEGEELAGEEQKEIFGELQGSDKSFSFVFQDEEGGTAYSWTFRGEEIKEPEQTVDFRIIVDANDKDVIEAAPDDVQEVDLKFIHEEILPGRAGIRVDVEEYFTEDTERLYLYYYNPEKGMLELLDDDVAFEDGYAYFYLEHCSSYILTAAMLRDLLPNRPTAAPRPTSVPVSTPKPTSVPVSTPKPTQAPVFTPKPTQEPVPTTEPTPVPTEEPDDPDGPEAEPTEEPDDPDGPEAVPTEEPGDPDGPEAVPTQEPNDPDGPEAEPTEKPDGPEVSPTAEPDIPDMTPGDEDSEDGESGAAAVLEPEYLAIRYTVARGDTLGKIARRYRTTVSELVRINSEIRDPNFIRVGQVILIRCVPEAEEEAGAYIIQKGDTLYGIARKHRLPLSALIEMNQELAAQRCIYPGQRVKVKREEF